MLVRFNFEFPNKEQDRMPPELFDGLRRFFVLARNLQTYATYTHRHEVKTKRNLEEAIRDSLGIAIAKKPYAVILSKSTDCNEKLTWCTETTKDEYNKKRPLILRNYTIVHTDISGSTKTPYNVGGIFQTCKQMLKCEPRKIFEYQKLTILTPIKEMYNIQNEGEFQHHIPISNVKVVIPRGPSQAKGLLSSCIRDDKPCVFLEPNNEDDKEEVSDDDYKIQLGKAEIIIEGEFVTMIGYGPQVNVLEKVATLAKEQLNVRCEVIDLKTLLPWDKETVINSVKKTKRCIIVEEVELVKGLADEIEKTIQDENAAVQKICGTMCNAQSLLSEVELLHKNINK